MLTRKELHRLANAVADVYHTIGDQEFLDICAWVTDNGGLFNDKFNHAEWRAAIHKRFNENNTGVTLVFDELNLYLKKDQTS